MKEVTEKSIIYYLAFAIVGIGIAKLSQAMRVLAARIFPELAGYETIMTASAAMLTVLALTIIAAIVLAILYRFNRAVWEKCATVLDWFLVW